MELQFVLLILLFNLSLLLLTLLLMFLHTLICYLPPNLRLHLKFALFNLTINQMLTILLLFKELCFNMPV